MPSTESRAVETPLSVSGVSTAPRGLKVSPFRTSLSSVDARFSIASSASHVSIFKVSSSLMSPGGELAGRSPPLLVLLSL